MDGCFFAYSASYLHLGKCFFRALGAKVDRVLTGITVIVMDSAVSMTFARDIRDRRQMSCIRLQHATGVCTCTAPGRTEACRRRLARRIAVNMG